MPHKRKKHDSSFSCETDIKRITAENGSYRRVLYTGPHSQLVLISIPPEGETAEQRSRRHRHHAIHHQGES